MLEIMVAGCDGPVPAYRGRDVPRRRPPRRAHAFNEEQVESVLSEVECDRVLESVDNPDHLHPQPVGSPSSFGDPQACVCHGLWGLALGADPVFLAHESILPQTRVSVPAYSSGSRVLYRLISTSSTHTLIEAETKVSMIPANTQ